MRRNRNQAVLTSLVALLVLATVSMTATALPVWVWSVAGASFIVSVALRLTDRGGDTVQS